MGVAERIQAIQEALKPQEVAPESDGQPAMEEAQAALQEAFQEALKAKPKRVRPKKLTPDEELVSLQRKWRLTYPDRAIPENLETLRRLIPSGLSKGEVRQFLVGSLEEAKTTFLRTYNTSWTKVDLERRVKEAGVANAPRVFEPRTMKDIQEAIRFLSDE